MGALNGILGAVDGIHTVRNWSVESRADLKELMASNTKSMPIQLAGNEDWSGAFSCFGDIPLKMPGDTLDFVGSVDGAKGCYGAAIVDAVEVSIDIESGDPIGYNVRFSGNGALTLGAAVVEDTTVPQEQSSIGCSAELGTMVAAPVWTPIAGVRTIGLSFSAANPNYVSSDTAGKVKRLKGNLKAAISLSVYEGDPEVIVVPNTLAALRVFSNRLVRTGTLETASPTVTITTTGLAAGQKVSGAGIPINTEILSVGEGVITLTENATATGAAVLIFQRFWELRWIRFGEAGGFEIDREGAAMIAYTLGGGFSGFALIDDAQTEGEIVMPDLVSWWPAA